MEVYKLGQTSTNIYKWWIWGDLVATLAIPAIQILLVHGKLRTAGVRSVFIVSPTRLHNYTWNTKKVSSDLWDITWYPQVTKCTHFKVTPRVPRFSTANGSNWFCGRQHLISKAKPPKTRHHYIQSHLITLILTFFLKLRCQHLQYFCTPLPCHTYFTVTFQRKPLGANLFFAALADIWLSLWWFLQGYC